MSLLLYLGIGLVLLIGLLAGLVLFHLIETPVDRRRIDAIAERLVTELRLEAATRETLKAMRQVARDVRTR